MFHLLLVAGSEAPFDERSQPKKRDITRERLSGKVKVGLSCASFGTRVLLNPRESSGIS